MYITVGQLALASVQYILLVYVYRRFKPASFKVVKISITKIKCFYVVDSNHFLSEWMYSYRMLPLSFNTASEFYETPLT